MKVVEKKEDFGADPALVSDQAAARLDPAGFDPGEGAVSHTPGEWRRDGLTIYALDETDSCNRFSTRVEGGWAFRPAASLGSSGDRTPDAELDANARLIAAAPELLAALEKLVEAVNTNELAAAMSAHHVTSFCNVTDALTPALAALTKAKAA